MLPHPYPIHDQWYTTLQWVLDTCEKLPKASRYTIASRIAELSVDTLEKITEALYATEKRHLLRAINLNLEKLRIFFRLCHDRRYISATQYEHIQTQINTTGKMVGGWLKSCKA
jgi:four helix bundle protein